MTRFGNEGSPRPVPKGVIELVKAAPATAGLSSDLARRESLRRPITDFPVRLAAGTRTDRDLALVELRSRFIVAHSLIATAVTVPSNAAAAWSRPVA